MFKRHRKFYLTVFFVLLVLFFTWWSWSLYQTLFGLELVKPKGEETTIIEVGGLRRAIDGLYVPIENVSSSLFAVMMDNFPAARPQAGLDLASLVWEAPVEGGMTRFLAVFPLSANLNRLGPVRSARPYYLDWDKELNALYLHVGGSNESLEKIKTIGIFDLNEFFRGWYFWRDNNRQMPYNVYTSTELISRAFKQEAKAQNWQKSDLASWRYKDELIKDERGDFTKLKINFSAILVEWRYNREANIYERWEDGTAQKAEDGGQITAKNVVVQVAIVKVLDEVGRREIKTTGVGPAVVLRDGQVIKGNWQKKSLAERTRFFDESNQEIEFNAGTTWIEVVEKGMYQLP